MAPRDLEQYERAKSAIRHYLRGGSGMRRERSTSAWPRMCRRTGSSGPSRGNSASKTVGSTGVSTGAFLNNSAARDSGLGKRADAEISPASIASLIEARAGHRVRADDAGYV